MTISDTPTIGVHISADGCIGEHDPAINADCAMAPANAPVVDIEAEVAKDLRGAVRNMAARAVDSDSSAEQYEESARRERALAEEYRAKVVVLRAHLATLGIFTDDLV